MRGTNRFDFLVIGAFKSGTTTLFDYFSDDARIDVPAAKELPFFDRDVDGDDVDRFVDQHFDAPQPGRLRGKVTPHYLATPGTAARIRRFVPDARLVAILREPLARARSHHRMQVRFGLEGRSFDDALRDELAGTVTQRFGYLATSEYGSALAAYDQHFPREQRLVVFTEDLENDPGETLATVYRHLGLDDTVLPDRLDRRSHAGSTRTRWPWAMQLARSPAGRAAQRAIPAAVAERVRFRFHMWNNDTGDASANPGVVTPEANDVPADLLEQVRARLEEDAVTLTELGHAPPWTSAPPPQT